MRKSRVVLAPAALAAACSSFGAEDPNPPPDAGAGSDAGTAPDAARPFVPCKERPTGDPAHFCDDFDRPGNVTFNWITRVSDGGSLGETDAAASAPRALVGMLKAGTAKADTYAIAARKKDPALTGERMTRLSFSFSLRIDRAPYPAGGTERLRDDRVDVVRGAALQHVRHEQTARARADDGEERRDLLRGEGGAGRIASRTTWRSISTEAPTRAP